MFLRGKSLGGYKKVATLLHTVSFFIALFVQSYSTPLAGAWVMFNLAGCLLLLYHGSPKPFTTLDKSIIAWFIALFISAFVFAPVVNGAATLAILAALPSLAMVLQKEDLPLYLKYFGRLILIYAIGLIIQKVLGIHSTINFGGRPAWPLLDPNNAAAIINLGLIPCVWMTLFRDKRWVLIALIFIGAMYATESKAGTGAALVSIFILVSARYGTEICLSMLLSSLVILWTTFIYRPDWIVIVADSFADRLPIWQESGRLLWVRPVWGLGLGRFSHYYDMVRTEYYTMGNFAHNDIYQFAIELGLPEAFVFCWLCYATLRATNKNNLVSGCAMLAVFLGAMVEFQFYVPAISLPMGLALAYHRLNQREPKSYANDNEWGSTGCGDGGVMLDDGA